MRLVALTIREMAFALHGVIPAKAGIHGAIEIGFPLSRE